MALTRTITDGTSGLRRNRVTTTTDPAVRMTTAEAIDILGEDGFVDASSVNQINRGGRTIYRIDGIDANKTHTGFTAQPGAKFILFYPYDYENTGAVTAGTAKLVALDPVTGQTTASTLVTGDSVKAASLIASAPTAGYSDIVPSTFGIIIEAFAATGESVDLMIEVHY